MDDQALLTFINSVDPTTANQIMMAGDPVKLELSLQGTVTTSDLTLLVGLQGNFPLVSSYVCIS